MTLQDIRRNDAAAAIEAYVDARRSGKLTSEFVHALLMLQDDPREVLKRIEQLKSK